MQTEGAEDSRHTPFLLDTTEDALRMLRCRKMFSEAAAWAAFI